MWTLVASVKDWASRHRRTVTCAVVVGGAVAGYAVYKKVAPIVAEMKNSYALLRQMEKDLESQRARSDQDRFLVPFVSIAPVFR